MENLSRTMSELQQILRIIPRSLGHLSIGSFIIVNLNKLNFFKLKQKFVTHENDCYGEQSVPEMVKNE